MIQQINLHNNNFKCISCSELFYYDVDDVNEFDNGKSLFWYLECPVCGEINIVTPVEYTDRVRRRVAEYNSV